MKSSRKIFLASIILSISTSSSAMMEIPFCPSGGPPGWINYFNYKQDQNRWRRQAYYPQSYPPASYYQNYRPVDYRYRTNNMPLITRDSNIDNNTYRQQPAQYNYNQ